MLLKDYCKSKNQSASSPTRTSTPFLTIHKEPNILNNCNLEVGILVIHIIKKWKNNASGICYYSGLPSVSFSIMFPESRSL